MTMVMVLVIVTFMTLGREARWNERMKENKVYALLTISCFPPEPPFLIIAPALVPVPFTPTPPAPGIDEGCPGCPE